MLRNSMEIMSSATLNPWLAELDMEDPLVLQEFIGDCLVDYSPSGEDNDHIDMAAANLIMEGVDDFYHSLSSASDCNSSNAAPEVISTSSPSKRQKLDHLPCSTNNAQNGLVSGLGGNSNSTSSAKRPKRQAEQCHNHIIAERQRRQTLSQRFIALSALIPGLKKMDKTSVLGEAIKHMKELKEKLKMFEEDNAKREVESVVVVRRSQVIVESDNENSTINNTTTMSMDEAGGSGKKQELLPEIEARFSNTTILIKIHCEMQKGILVKLMTQIEKLNLTVTNTYAMPFNATTLDITIMVEREVEFDKTPQDVVKALRSIFERL